MESVWSAECKIAQRESLGIDLEVDVLVIGAGMAGILTAYLLKCQGLDVVILEADRIGSGVTQNTTAKITSQHGLFYDKLITDFGLEKARQYAAANQDAVKRFKQMIESKNISCHFEEKSAFVYTLADCEKIRKEVLAAEKVGINAAFVKETELPFKINGAVEFKNQAQFNPLEFISVISNELRIYENTRVTEVKDNIALTDKGKVRGKSVVVATHYPFINVPGYYFLKMHQERSYVIALENMPVFGGMYIDESSTGFSFRSYDNYLLLGGSGHRTGENKTGGCYEKLREAARNFYPASVEKFHWSTQDCVSVDCVPYIGKYCTTSPDMYVATGFKKWGMTSSMVAATIITDMIMKNEEQNAKIFSPQRFNVKASAKNLAQESGHAAKSLAKQIFKIPKEKLDSISNSQGGIVEHEGKTLGVYKSENGQTFIVSTKCPHLGCALEWNQDELSWDCPCHGSRFTYEGKLINNPAQVDLNKN